MYLVCSFTGLFLILVGYFLLLGVLPVPSLVLQQQTDVWHLLCTGSPAYPGCVFSLYVADSELPVATYRAKTLHHQVIFPVPVQDSPVTFYQCQYRAPLGSTWSLSERSVPLALTTGRNLLCYYMQCFRCFDF